MCVCVCARIRGRVREMGARTHTRTPPARKSYYTLCACSLRAADLLRTTNAASTSPDNTTVSSTGCRQTDGSLRPPETERSPYGLLFDSFVLYNRNVYADNDIRIARNASRSEKRRFFLLLFSSLARARNSDTISFRALPAGRTFL